MGLPGFLLLRWLGMGLGEFAFPGVRDGIK